MSNSQTVQLGETPTFSVTLSWDPSVSRPAGVQDVARVCAAATVYGVTAWQTVGTWDGSLELGVRVEFQGPSNVWKLIMAALARAYPECRMAHVEVRVTNVTWRDLEDYRD